MVVYFIISILVICFSVLVFFENIVINGLSLLPIILALISFLQAMIFKSYRKISRTTRKNISIENLIETEFVTTESIADELIREEEERQAYNKRIHQARELLDCLTEKQRQR